MFRSLHISADEPGELSIVLSTVLPLSGKKQDDHMFLEQVMIESWDNENTTIHAHPLAGGMSRRALRLLLGPRIFERINNIDPSNIMTYDCTIEVTEEEYAHIVMMIAIDTENYMYIRVP